MNKITNNWNIESFLKWWETKQERFHCGQFSEKEVAYSAWLAGIDYYIDNVEEKSLPFASMDGLYDDDDGGINMVLHTPKPRELSEKEIDRFNLRYHGGKELKPSYEHTGNIWAAADDGKLPTYRFYNSCSINGTQVTSGINCLIILKYTPNKDVWEKINLDDVDTFYGVVWFMCLELQKKNESLDLKQCKHHRVKKGGEWSTYGHYDIYYKCLDCNSIFYQDQTSTDKWNALKEKENKQ